MNNILKVISPIIAYHVENNTDVFYQEVPEGSTSIIIGYLGNISLPLVIVGGAYAVRGFDATGKEHFWFLPGGNVKALELLDTDDDGLNEVSLQVMLYIHLISMHENYNFALYNLGKYLKAL